MKEVICHQTIYIFNQWLLGYDVIGTQQVIHQTPLTFNENLQPVKTI